MSKTIKMPTDRGSRITVEINGKKYVYAAGVQYTVPDEVAAAIDNSLAEKPKDNPTSVKKSELAGVEAEIAALSSTVGGIGDRVTALDNTANGAVPALDTRVTALDTPETGAIAQLDSRVTALEQEDDTEPATNEG